MKTTSATTSPPPTAAAAVGRPPLQFWQQYLISYTAGRVYDMTVGPPLRQGVERVLQRPWTKPYVPPLTPGFVARDLVYGGAIHLIGNKAFQLMVAATERGAKTAASGLTSANGLTGANAAAAGASAAGAAVALRMMAVRTLGMTAVMTALDAVFATYVGPQVEEAVNRVFGGSGATRETELRRGVPASIVPQSLEQATRNFTHNYVGALAFTLAWKEAGLPVAQLVLGRVGGPGGAILGALAGAVVTSAVNHLVTDAIGSMAADAAQQGVRLLKRALGMRLDPLDRRPDLVPTMGDRISGNVRGVAVPFVTAMASGRPREYVTALVPAPVSTLP